MAQIEGAYLHEKLDGVVYEIALYDSVEDVGDCYYQCGYKGQTAYIAATEDKESEAYQKYGTPATFRRKDGTEFWLLTQVYIENHLNLTDIELSCDEDRDIDFDEFIDTNGSYDYNDIEIVENGDDLVRVCDGYIEIGGINETFLERKAVLSVTVTFSDGSTTTGTVTVTQAGVEKYLDTTDIEDVPASGGTYDLNEYVDTNADSVSFEVTDGSGWLSIDGEITAVPIDVTVDDDLVMEPITGSTLAVASNTGAARTGTVKVTGTFSDGSTMEKTITVSQQTGYYLNVKGIETDYEAKSIPLASEGYLDTNAVSLEWEYVDGDDNWQDWLSILHADEPLAVEFEFTKNAGTEIRTARFDVSATFDDDETVLSAFISITQLNGGEITAE